MESEFLAGFRSVLESGDFQWLETMYAADAGFEGYLPGGLREAVGPAAIVGVLAQELGPSPEIVAWNPIRATTVDVEIRRGDPQERKRQIHKVAISDGLIRRHWAYPALLDSLLMGDSGARHRRVERPDGSLVFEKQISPSHDWIMRATHDLGREATLWLDGPLRDLPPSIEYPIVSADRTDDGWLITTRDIRADLMADEPTLGDWRTVIDRLAELHARFRGHADSRLCSIADRLAIFSEETARAEIGGSDRYPKLLQHGWREAPGLLPPDLAGPVLGLARDPARLIRALGAGPLTLIHGDAFTTNLGVRDGRLIALDWALAAYAPVELEFTWLLSGSGELRDEVIELARAALAGPGDDRRWRIALLFEFVYELAGLTYTTVTGAPEAVDANAATLAWWFDRAREGLLVLEG